MIHLCNSSFGRCIEEYFKISKELILIPEIIIIVVEQFKSDLTSEELTLHARYQLEYFSAERAFDLEAGVHFRPVTENDINEFSCTSRRDMIREYNQLSSDDWILEINKRIRKPNKSNSPPCETLLDDKNFRVFIDNIIISLNLALPGKCCFRLLDKGIASPYLSVIRTVSSPEQKVSRSNNNIIMANRDIELLINISSYSTELDKALR